LTSFI